MKTRVMKQLRWPTNAEQAAHMAEMQRRNRAVTYSNPHENWMAEKLNATGLRWSRQATWGYRVFDFWCAQLGLAVEVDGPDHDIAYDNYRDEYNYRRSGILVLRVRNSDEDDAAAALRVIAESEPWKQRRERLGISASTKAGRRQLVNGQGWLL